jgi:hypothetical protein
MVSDSLRRFATSLGKLPESTHAERAIALLWYYRHSQEFEERTPGELAMDLAALGFPKPRVDRLTKDLLTSGAVARGLRKGAVQVDIRRLAELDERYLPLLGEPAPVTTDSILPASWADGTKPYFERMIRQINGCYDHGFYDGCAVLMRRLLESLLIETFVTHGLVAEIRPNNQFVGLDSLINKAVAQQAIHLPRGSKDVMDKVKFAGDTAAHDRTYITTRQDVDDLKAPYRKLIHELLTSISTSSPKGGAKSHS